MEPKDKEEDEMIKTEIDILKNLSHPNIIQIKEVFDKTKVLKV